MTPIDETIQTALQGIVGPDRVLTDADSLLQYGRDWTRAYTPRPAAVVLPSTIEQVQDVVAVPAPVRGLLASIVDTLLSSQGSGAHRDTRRFLGGGFFFLSQSA